MGAGLESLCVGRVCGGDGVVHGTIRTVHHPKLCPYPPPLFPVHQQQMNCEPIFIAVSEIKAMEVDMWSHLLIGRLQIYRA